MGRGTVRVVYWVVSVDGVVSTDTVGECAVRAAQGGGTQQPAAAVLCVVVRGVNSKNSGQCEQQQHSERCAERAVEYVQSVLSG